MIGNEFAFEIIGLDVVIVDVVELFTFVDVLLLLLLLLFIV